MLMLTANEAAKLMGSRSRWQIPRKEVEAYAHANGK
jgi:hypothetical protein